MRFLLFLTALVGIFSTAQSQDYYFQNDKVEPLRTNYYFDVTDNVTNTNGGYVDNYNASQQQWQYGKPEGFVLSEGSDLVKRNPGQFTRLNLYYDDVSKDYLTLSDEMEDYATADGSNYKYVKTLGYLYKTANNNTIPVRLTWNTKRGDYNTVAQKEAVDNAKNFGYTDIGVMGHILTPGIVSVYFQGYRMVPVQNSYYYEAKDHVLNARGGYLESRKGKERYVFPEIEGYMIAEIDGEAYDEEEILPLALYRDKTTDTHKIYRFTPATPESEKRFEFISLLGYAFVNKVPNTKPMEVVTKGNDWYYSTNEEYIKKAKADGYRPYMINFFYLLVID